MLFDARYLTGISAVAITAVVALLAACGQEGAFASTELDARVAKLESRLTYLQDRQQIHEMYLRYMRGFDRNDVERMKSAFWPDVQINYGSQSNTLDEFIVRHLNEHTRELASWGHLLTNESVDIDGDVAHVETYVTALWSLKKDTPTRAGGATIASGRYIDRLDRRNGEWRIAVREFVGHFTARTEPVWDFSKAGRPPSDCTVGTWDKRDPSYRRPLTARTIQDTTGPACDEQ